VVSDPWRLPFPDAAFDVVLAVRLLAHVTAWRELLAEMARVAGRAVVVDFPVRGALHALAPALFGAKRRVEGNTRPYFDYHPDEIVQALAAQGFETAAVVRQFAMPMVVHRALRAPGLSRRMEALARASGITARTGSPVLLRAGRIAPASAGREETTR
jgi:ubiquinone/menaquinone biosynthesis C-methylase UbiE